MTYYVYAPAISPKFDTQDAHGQRKDFCKLSCDIYIHAEPRMQASKHRENKDIDLLTRDILFIAEDHFLKELHLIGA